LRAAPEQAGSAHLREEQARYKEALDSYRTAVKLDPDYLNAWVKIESISGHVYLPAAERDSFIFNILRLDPSHLRGTPSFELVSDLSALWKNMTAANGKLLKKPESLYPLPASKAEVEKREAKALENGTASEMEYRARLRDSEEATTPGGAVARNGFVRAAEHLLGREVASAWGE
jgi:tetratricopeptide (TPR) repeat protein